ncbi:MAG: 2,3-bisphosphoglycerate-dependent phosphoglycerate mutase [Micrococcales bacterium]|nr:2,3-bisphosphoglycerate-dependent phosphoglycerate mutase [Micrococcales bacterium]
MLVLVRHGESEYNAEGRWTGITDVPLTAKGRADARRIGTALRDLAVTRIYVSQLKRTVQTKDGILEVIGAAGVQVRKTAALNERDYGDYTGLDKWGVKRRVGDEEFATIRRAFDAVIPGGESLRDVFERVVPWYREIVVPLLAAGENVLIVAHGNSARALRKYLESVGDEDMKDLEMDFDKICLYRVDAAGAMVEAQVRRF